MRRFLLSACVVLGIVPAWGDEAPQAKLVEANQELGTVFAGMTVSGKFYVENTGTVPFTITDAKPTCHCTTAVVSKEKVEPGKRGEISYQITTNGVGKNVKNIRIVTDPPLAEQLIFTASVTFAPFIETDAKDLAIDVPQGDPINARIPLHLAKGVGNIKLTGATTRARGWTASLEGPGDGADYFLVMKSTDTIPAGKRPVQTELEFDKDGKGMQSLTVTFNIIPAIQVSPAPIMVKFDPGKDQATIPITLKSTRGTPFTVTSVTAKVCKIHDVTLPKAPAAEQKIDLTFDRADAKTSRGFLTFEFSGELGSQTIYAIFDRTLGASAPAARLPTAIPATK